MGYKRRLRGSIAKSELVWHKWWSPQGVGEGELLRAYCCSSKNKSGETGIIGLEDPGLHQKVEFPGDLAKIF